MKPIFADILDTDWIWTKITGITPTTAVPTGDWTPYLPTNERQKNASFESDLCVTFSGHQTIATYLNYMVSNKLLSDNCIGQLKDLGYFDENGKVNFNEMFSANLNGSSPNGDTFGDYWYSIRHDGLLPQKDWYDIYNDIHSFQELYRPVPQNLKDKAKKILNLLEINYHWVLTGSPNDPKIKNYLTYSPLQTMTPVCDSWNSENVLACNKKNLQHATMIFKHNGNGFGILDHYLPFQKNLTTGYHIPYAIGIYITEKTPIGINTEQIQLSLLSKVVNLLAILVGKLRKVTGVWINS